MRVARASFTRRAWVMMAVAAISAAAIAVLLLVIVTEAYWNVKRCCTDFRARAGNDEELGNTGT
jgi:cell division protein FtsX